MNPTSNHITDWLDFIFKSGALFLTFVAVTKGIKWLCQMQVDIAKEKSVGAKAIEEVNKKITSIQDSILEIKNEYADTIGKVLNRYLNKRRDE